MADRINTPYRARKHENLICWLAGAAVASLLFAALALTTELHYFGNDDLPLLRATMGYEGGEIAGYNLILHGALLAPLRALAKLAPGVAWFSIYQLFILWLSTAVIVKSAARVACRNRLPLALGAAVGAAFALVYGWLISCRISFSTTAAWAGAAAICQLWSVEYREGGARAIVWGMLGSCLMLLQCYFLRQISVLPALAAWLLSALAIWLTWFARARGSKPFWLGLLLCATLFCAMVGMRAAENAAPEARAYIRWDNARSSLLDYTDFNETTDEAMLDEIGWSWEEFMLFQNWYFMDASVTTEGCEALYQMQPEAAQRADVRARLPKTADRLLSFLREDRASVAMLMLMAGMLLGCLLLQLLARPARPWLWLCALGAALICAAMLGYLAYDARMPMRAVVTAVFPTAATLCMLLLHALSREGRAKKARPWVAAVCGLCCLLLGYQSFALSQESVRSTTFGLDENGDVAEYVNFEDLSALALENPDMLIVYDLSLANDARLFPDTSEGVPGNLMFLGGWQARSPGWYRQLEKFGFDGHSFAAPDFLRDNILYASTDGMPSELLQMMIEEKSGEDVDWDFFADRGYVGLYQYIIY